ncbi:MAG: hypothetical protein GY772_26450 [bacterium]|nr:hypothetical protein [bacterium]
MWTEIERRRILSAMASTALTKKYTGVSRSDLMRRDLSRKRAASKKRADGKKQEQELMATGVRAASGAAMGWAFASYPQAASLSIPGSSGAGVDTTLLVGVGAKLAVLGADAPEWVSQVGDAALVLFAAGMAQDFVTKKE